MGNKSGNGDKAKSRLNSTRLEKSKPPTQSNNKGSGLHAIVETMGLPISAVSSLWAIEPRILLDAAALETADTVMASVAGDHLTVGQCTIII